LEEVWNLCEPEFVEDDPPEAVEGAAEDCQPHQLCLMLSSAALSVTPASQTLRLQGSIGGYSVNILLDSGSSRSFINSSVASKLDGVQRLPSPVNVKVADDTNLVYSSRFPSVAWSTNGLSFHLALKILPLGLFDLILGMD
jgi:hypothetical protein